MNQFNESLYLQGLEKAASLFGRNQRQPKPSFNPPADPEDENQNTDIGHMAKKTAFGLTDDVAMALSKTIGHIR